MASSKCSRLQVSSLKILSYEDLCRLENKLGPQGDLPAETGQATPSQVNSPKFADCFLEMKPTRPSNHPTRGERRLYGQLPEETCNWDISSHLHQQCSVRYMVWSQHVSFLPCLSHHTRRFLSSCYHIRMLGWPGHVSAAAAAVTQTAFRWPCSPGTVCAKDIRKLAQGEGGSQTEGRAASRRE